MPFSSSYRLFLGLISLSPSFRKPQINVYIFQSVLTAISEQPRNLSGFTNFSFMLQSSESVPDWKAPLHGMIQGSRLFPPCGLASCGCHLEAALNIVREVISTLTAEGAMRWRTSPGSGANHCHSCGTAWAQIHSHPIATEAGDAVSCVSPGERRSRFG